jgi:carboxymethylenebutenolidase
MADERHTISRREFTALTVAAGVSAATGVTAAPVTEAVDTDVSVKTPSGTCDAALVHPQGSGRWPAIILFPDAFGLRPTMRAMAKRLAMDGYTVLVPNPYYRSTKAPGIAPDFDFGNPTDRAKLAELRAPLTSDAVMQDAAAYVAFLDSGQPRPDRRGRVVPRGRLGYR